MKRGSIVLARIQQADGLVKSRPVVIIQEMPPFADFLVCAVSSQLRHECVGFEEILNSSDIDFRASGLKVSSLIRLGLVATIPQNVIMGELGIISNQRLQVLQSRLAEHIKCKQ